MNTQIDLLQAVITRLNAKHVMTIDDNNVVLAWHDQGSYNGKPYNKYRIGIWYWATRNSAWQQGSGSCSVPYERKGDLLAGLTNVYANEIASAKLALVK
jgi:hypothetical protein